MKPHPAPNKEARRRKRPPASHAAAIIMTFTLLAASIFGSMSPVFHQVLGAPEPIEIREVNEDEFEEPGYSSSINFTDIKVINGWTYQEEISQYYSTAGTPPLENGDRNTVAPKGPGYAFFIDSSTKPDPNNPPTLRYTGGKYGRDDVDALVSIVDWDYVEPSNGWSNFWDVSQGWFETFKPGVFVSDLWKSGVDDSEGYQNFNFYTVGLANLQVNVTWVYAGSDTPIDLKGHMTCMDLDVNQSFGFGGSIIQARYVSNNDHLSVADNSTRIQSSRRALVDQYDIDPIEYRMGLVGTYYDTTKETGKVGKPAELYFGTSWRNGATNNCVSFFAMTSEFLTIAPPEEDLGENLVPPVKAADKTSGVSLDDHVTYSIDFTAHEEGVNCRGGYRYTNLDIIDILPDEMRYVNGSGYITDADGKKIDNAGRVIYEGDNENPTENTVRFEFNPDYLQTMRMKGEHYVFVFEAVLTEYPKDGQRIDGKLYVRNSSYALINHKGKLPSNDVDTTLLEPELTVDKTADSYEYQVDDIINYTVIYQQATENAQARQVVISDNLPEGLELIGDSVHATGLKDLPDPDVNENKWSYSFDKFNYGDTITVTYQARATSHGNGREIVNNASIHANNAVDQDDPAEVWINTASLDITKEVDRYEGYVGSSDIDPGFFEYTVTLKNTKHGTIANDVVISDDSLPKEMPVGRNNDGALRVEVKVDDGSGNTMTWVGDRAEGSFADVAYPVGDDDTIHNQTAPQPVTWNLDPSGTGWKLSFDHLNDTTTVTVTYRAYPQDAASGWEVENKAIAQADNSSKDEDTALVWINQPHLAVDKEANLESFSVGDHIVYHVTVTNETPGTLGRDLVISDLAHTEGVELIRGSIRVYDSRNEDITDECTISSKHGQETFIVQTHRDIINKSDSRSFWKEGELHDAKGRNPLDGDGETSITVEYQVAISDAELAGKTIDNTALAVTDEPNTQTTDDEVVNVDGARLIVEKSSDKPTYHVGDVAVYTLVIRQTREAGIARQVVIHDAFDQVDLASIAGDSIAVTGPDGNAVDVEPEFIVQKDERITGFEIPTGIDLEDEQAITVSYQVNMEAPAQMLDNKARAQAEGSLEGVDQHSVEILEAKPQASISKTVQDEKLALNETARYTVRATLSSGKADNAVIADTSLPKTTPIDFDSIAVTKNGTLLEDGFKHAGNGFTVACGSLAAGDEIAISYNATPSDPSLKGTSVVNVATLDFDGLDEPLADDAVVHIEDDADDEPGDPDTPDDPDPDGPDNPNGPNDVDEPSNPDQPDTPGTDDPDKDLGKDLGKTGDWLMSNLPTVTVLGVAICICLAAIITHKRPRH